VGDPVDLTSIESLFACTGTGEPVNQFGVVRKGAVEGMGEMPPIELVGGSPAEGPGQGGCARPGPPPSRPRHRPEADAWPGSGPVEPLLSGTAFRRSPGRVPHRHSGPAPTGGNDGPFDAAEGLEPAERLRAWQYGFQEHYRW